MATSSKIDEDKLFIDFAGNIGDALTGLPTFIANAAGFSSNYPALYGESVGYWIDALVATNNVFSSF